MIKCPHCNFEFDNTGKTNSQNAYFHLIVSLIADETGESFDYVKTFLKDHFGFYSYVSKSDEAGRFKVYESVATMTKKRLNELIDKAYMFAVDNGISVMTPQEYFEMA